MNSCERCGSCCLQISEIINVTEEDIQRWVTQRRFDILQYCYGWDKRLRKEKPEKIISHLINGINNEMWFNPNSRDELFLCPFLRKVYGKPQFRCMIHDTKPEICKDYFCNPADMKKIVKKPFQENLKEYRRRKRLELNLVSRQNL